MRDILTVQKTEMKKSLKTGNMYGQVTLMGMGVSPITLFANEEIVKNLVDGKEYEFEFNIKGKELNGIVSYKAVK